MQLSAKYTAGLAASAAVCMQVQQLQAELDSTHTHFNIMVATDNRAKL
jgi:hypothetical protein